VRHHPLTAPARRRVTSFYDTLVHWCDLVPVRVANRPASMASNASKGFQIQKIRQLGFAVPETLATNDPEAVREFLARHGRVIYKSISGVRSIVREIDEAALARIDLIRWCPVQFQAFVPGVDVRVHTIGETVFATAIHSDVVDYRYAARQGGTTRYEPYELPPSVAKRCTALTSVLGLEFAGIDLKAMPTGEFCCFEVNPSPAYSHFEEITGQPISRALALHLASGAPP